MNASLKYISEQERAAIPDDRFAGPNHTFPIDSQAHVFAAAHLYGRAADPAAVRARIIEIAKRQGYALPEGWETGPDNDNDADNMPKKSVPHGIETKSFDIKADILTTDAPGTLHAIVSVFGNEDSVGDVMVKGAFANSIKAGKAKGALPPGVWAHDWTRPIAKTLDAFETDEGLNIIALFNLETQDGRDAYSNIKNGLFNEYSFGFQRMKEDEKDGKTYVKDVKLYEWSPVLVGANSQTRTVAVKQYIAEDLPTERAFERFLRDSGLSRKEAVTTIALLFKGLQRDADEAASQEAQEQSEPPQDAESPPADPPDPITEAAPEAQPPTEAAVFVAAPVVEKADSRAVAALYANFLTFQARQHAPQGDARRRT